MPDVRLIAVLRDPVDRTISHYFHNVKLGFGELSLEEAIDRGADLAPAERPDNRSPASKVRRARWQPRGIRAGVRTRITCHGGWPSSDDSQILVIEAESLYDDPAATTATVCDFLQLPQPQSQHFAQHNAGKRTGVDGDLVAWLTSTFREPNGELRQLLQARLGDRSPDLRWAR